MPVLASTKDCTGCTACFAACNHKAIIMQADALGFKYPEINPDLCIECKRCEKVCPIISPTQNTKDKKEIDAYAGQLKNQTDLKKSQSGGAFYGIASTLITKNYVIYGAAFDYHLHVTHQSVRHIEDLDRLKGSKYVQSDLMDIFKDVLTQLKNEGKVLFTGTPCQIAGLINYLPKQMQKNLLTIDLICHGVPAPKIYEDYIKFLQKKHRKRIIKFIFRDKEHFGWRKPRETFIFDNGEKKSSYHYNYLFLEKDLLARPACGNCRYCNLDRVSDITIADCWGWEKLGMTTIDEKNGISLIIPNTEVGKELVQKLENTMTIVKVPLKPNLLQRNLVKPTSRPLLADTVATDFVRFGFAYIDRHYGYNSFGALKRRFKRCLVGFYKRIKK